MKKLQIQFWTESLLYSHNIFMHNSDLLDLIKNYINLTNKEKPKINKKYSLTKDFDGVVIDIGEVIILKSSLNQIQELMNDFVKIVNNQDYYLLQDNNKINKWSTILSLPESDKDKNEGYIFNNELVNFYKDNNGIHFLQFKYKDPVNSSYNLYRFAFINEGSRYFLLRIQLF